MPDYHVNLPKTDFPMKADLPRREPKILDFWQSIDLYNNFFYMDREQKFILHDGPPYANGAVHLGHALNKVLKDIILKIKALDGYAAPYVPGWDCHGLPIELNVEKKIGHVGAKVSAEQFIAACRKYADEQLAAQRADFIRLGVLGDWQHPYKTADFQSEAAIIRALGKVIANGYVERGFKPVHWCIACGSALAEAEVEYQDKTSPAIDVRFRVVDPTFFKVPKVTIPIWTTTPWTLPANEAVCLHPDLEYVLVYAPKYQEHFVVLAELLAAVMQRFGEDQPQIKAKYLGKELAGIMLQHPFLDKQVPVILGLHVTVDAGTGAVHTAPAHGQEDFAIGREYNLPVKNPVGPDGKFLKDTQYFAGLNVFAANDEVIKVLTDKNSLIHAETLQHSYPHCWRHKKPLIFRATQQWFVSMDKKGVDGTSLREKALAAIEHIQWYPENGKTRMQEMLTNRPDWCISRQRVWGTPIALFVHKATGELHPAWEKLLALVVENIEREGVLYWHQLASDAFLKQHAPEFASEDFVKVTDTLDVWFDSGTTHYYVLQQNPTLQFPADLYLEGNDQYRGWFQSSLLTALAINGIAPYKQIVTHGFTVDAQGHKMSKSIGNVIAPQQVTEKFGADVLRLWVAATYTYDDFPLSDEILQRNVDAYRIFRNTARFLLGNLFDFDVATDLLPVEQMLALDRWAVSRLLELQKLVQADAANYKLYSACSNIQATLTTEISSFYFSVIKDRLYTMAAKSIGRRSAQTALFYILEIFVRILAPICSFTAEEIWQELRKIAPQREASVFLSRWFTLANAPALTAGNLTDSDWRNIRLIRDEVNKNLEELRIAGKIGSSLAAEVTLYCDATQKELLRKLHHANGNELRFILITSEAHLQDSSATPLNAAATAIPGLHLLAEPSTHKKCCRCWHYRADVGAQQEHPELCGRCGENLFGGGEQRYFA